MSGAPMRIMTAGLCVLLSILASSCGGSDSGFGSAGSGSGSTSTTVPSGSNVAPVIVDSGPVGNSANTLFVSVTLCVPGSTTNCQTIDHIEVDTASYGLRILSSALTLTLPAETLTTGGTLLECTNFVQGYSWGPVVATDLTIAGETASSIPVQVIGTSTYTVPDDCSGLGTAVDTVTEFGANGVLGVGPFVEDCGSGCAQNAVPTTYYACTATSTCVATAVATTAQVQNPVASFTADNNGVIVQMPSVASGGAASVSGYLIFGVDTQTNNVSNSAGTETVLEVSDEDYLTALFDGATFTQSFIDSGSNGLYFNGGGLPTCTETDLTDFYCPTSTVAESATLSGINGLTTTVDFSIANTVTLLSASSSLTAFSDLGGTFPGTTTSFDFGVPFYFGRRVATVIAGNTTTVGTGPYFAF